MVKIEWCLVELQVLDHVGHVQIEVGSIQICVYINLPKEIIVI